MEQPASDIAAFVHTAFPASLLHFQHQENSGMFSFGTRHERQYIITMG